MLGTLVAAVLGLAVAMAGRAPSRFVTVPVRIVTEFVRSTPLLVQLVGAAALFNTVEPLYIGIAVLGVHYAAYTSEVYRAGIDGVPKGQWEACRALSLSPRRTWQAVILPQAVRNVLPALGNYAISMFKETPFLAVITVQEMVFEARKYGAEHFAYTEVFTLDKPGLPGRELPHVAVDEKAGEAPWPLNPSPEEDGVSGSGRSPRGRRPGHRAHG